jgi:hypothetical protein
MKQSFLLAAFLLALGGLASHSAHAQAPGTGGPTPQPAAVPLDGGASLLAASGVAYGLRYLRQRRKQAQ